MQADQREMRAPHALEKSELREIIRRIVARFHPVRIVLFGSAARGDNGLESDLDLFVEMESDRRPPERAADVAAVFGLRPWSLDVVVYTPDEVRRLKGRKGTLLWHIEREGKVVYERG